MRPPILWITVAFGAGLASGLDLFAVRGAWYVVASVIAAALWLARHAPLGAAMGIMGVAGLLWGGAALRERAATCAGRWTAGEGPVKAGGKPGKLGPARRSCGSAIRRRTRAAPSRRTSLRARAAARCGCAGPTASPPRAGRRG